MGLIPPLIEISIFFNPSLINPLNCVHYDVTRDQDISLCLQLFSATYFILSHCLSVMSEYGGGR